MWGGHRQYSEEELFQQLVDKLKSLLKRQNLCHNTYIYKKMHSRLTIPLSLICQECSIARITNDQEEIIRALQDTKLVKILNAKEVQIIQFPTVKISMTSHQGLRELERILEEKDIPYEISKRVDTETFINLTVFSGDIDWLEKLIQNIDKKILYQKADLMQDIKFGVERIRKLKVEHAKIKTALGKQKYSLTSPPEVFVRKAIDTGSSSEQQVQGEECTKPEARRGHEEKRERSRRQKKLPNGTKDHKKEKKPLLMESDFPSL